ncbi:MAG: nicotinate-nucleotide adenylyltransferase [Caulobacteraceae bacterium]
MWISGPARRVSAAGRVGSLRPGFQLQRGMRVGLLGGSFNPAHEGHAHVAETALTRLRLDKVIWLVSPQNPLKPAAESASLSARMASARRMARGPHMIVSDVEQRVGSRYTIDILRILKQHFPGVRFVWLMGGHNLNSLLGWRGWVNIMREMPVAVIARPGAELKSRSSPAARRFAHARLSSRESTRLAGSPSPAWLYIRAPFNFVSSTALRARLRARDSGAS